MAVAKEYVSKLEGVYRIGDTRVSLDSLVYLFREGMSAESMVESYPALTLEQVRGGSRTTWPIGKKSMPTLQRANGSPTRSTRSPGERTRN